MASNDVIRFNNLYDEINKIENEQGENKVVNLIKKNKFKKLFLKINDFVELKLIVQYEYPKVSPNSIQIFYSKISNLDSDNDDTVEEFFKVTKLALNETVDRSHGKCCVYSIYQQLKDLAAANNEIYLYLQKIDTFSTVDDKDDLIQELINKKVEEKKNSKNTTKNGSEKTKLRGSDVIFQRIKWDESIDKKMVVIGYLDRFKGVMEIPFNDFKGVHDDYREGIPLHRIRHYKINDKIVWDREKRIDLLTGHEVGDYFQSSEANGSAIKTVEEPKVDKNLLDGVTLRYNTTDAQWIEGDQNNSTTKNPIKQLKVLTYNILSTGNFKLSIKYANQHGASGIDKLAKLDRMSKILDCIVKSDADIIALQECDLEAEDEIKNNAIIQKKYFICSSNFLNNETNCVVLTKLTPASFKLLRLLDKSTKMALILKFNVSLKDNEEIWFSNIHLTSDKSTNAPVKRRQQLEKLTDFMLKSSNGTHFICGDFNTGVESVEDNETVKLCLTDNDFIDLAPQFNTFNPKENFTAAITSASQKIRRFDRLYMKSATSNNYKICSRKVLNTSPLIFEDIDQVNYEPYGMISSYCSKDIIDLDADSENLKKVPAESSKVYLHPSDHYALEIMIDFKPAQEKPLPAADNTKGGYQAALAIVVPRYASQVIQEIRQKYDRTFNRWPPHINLIYPFCEEMDVQSVAYDLLKILSKYEPFCVDLNQMNHFASNCVVYIEPDKQAEANISKIQKDLRDYFSKTLKNIKPNFAAHLTIAQPEQRRDVEKGWSLEMVKTISDEYGKTFSTEFSMEGVYWLTRNGANDPFRVRHVFPIGKNYPAIQYGLNLDPPTSGIIGFLKDRDRMCVSDELLKSSDALISTIYQALCNSHDEEGNKDEKNCETFKPHYYKVLPIGSYRFGIRFHDIDLVILKQKPKSKANSHNLFEKPREEFTRDFSQVLAQDQDIFYIARAIVDANVPIIEITLNESSKKFKSLIDSNVHGVDIQIYQIPNDDRFFLGKGYFNSYQEHMKEIANALNHDYTQLYQLSAIFESDSIKTHVKYYKDFQILLSFVKLWADNRSIYGKGFGYLGGISYALLCAYFLKRHESEFDQVLEVDFNNSSRLLKILVKFFEFYSTFNWHKEIVSLVDMNIVNEEIKRFQEYRQRTPISVLQSVYPYYNTTHNLKDSSKEIIVNELKRTQKLIEEFKVKNNNDLSKVYELCENICKKYELKEDNINSFIKFKVNYEVKDDIYHIFSIMKSKTQGLVYQLERLSKGDFIMRVLPELEISKNTESTKKYDNLAEFTIGIRVNDKINKNKQNDIDVLCKAYCDNVVALSYTSQFEIEYLLKIEQ